MSAVEHIKAHLVSTGIADDGGVTLSEVMYAIPTSLRVGDFTAFLSLCSTSLSPPTMKACCSGDGSCTIRFTRDCAVYIQCVSLEIDAVAESWLQLCSATQITVSFSPVEVVEEMPTNDPHVVYATWCADEYGVLNRCRGDIEGHYGSYTSFFLKDRQYSVRPLLYLPPGADARPLVLRIVKDLLMLWTTGVVVHHAFFKQNVTVHVYPCIGIFDYPMAAKFSNTIEAPGVEHCTSCDIVSQKTSSVRQGRTMNSAQFF